MPAGSGRQRGFRAPTPDERAQVDATESSPSGAEELVVGPPPRRWHLPRWQGRPALLAMGAALVVAVLVVAVLAFRLGSAATPTATGPAETPTPTPATTPSALPVTEVYQRVLPSVVVITTSKGALGTGTVVTDTGTVLTANHVISGGGAITVRFADGTKAAATVASGSAKTDVATLTPKKLPEVVVAAPLGGGVVVGADVVAVGNPLGLSYSTSAGVVSGLNRSAKTSAGALTGLIQFDAAVNPGSSGGPLLDDQGLVIGVVSAIADPGKDEAFAGIGFAVPIATALSGGGGDGDGPEGGPQL